MSGQTAADLISLPQGGGALRAIGETFQADLSTGTGGYSIPIEVPEGRAGVQPQLALAYSSGSGCGPFGIGWSVAVPSIRRRTRPLPGYGGDDAFVLSGAEELVAVPGGDPGEQRYRPRVEGLYARIVRHSDGDVWRVWSREGMVSVYGAGVARIADPDDPRRVCAWLISETADTFGNRMRFRYRTEPGSPQRYLSEIAYVDHGDPGDPSFLVTIRFVYAPAPVPSVDRRCGFAVTTGLRCARIETWIDAGAPQLTRSVALTYADELGRPAANGVSLLARVVVTGHDGAELQSLPALELDYTAWAPSERRYRPLTGANGAGMPVALRRSAADLVDVTGDGLPDVLELNRVARWWRNRGDGAFDPPRALALAPAGVALGTPGVAIADLDGDGRHELLVSGRDRAGYYTMTQDGGFAPGGYVGWRSAPVFDLTDPELRLVDLDGDGAQDAVRTGAGLELYFRDPEVGWTRARVSGRTAEVPVSFSDPRVRLADMTGDDLSDIVLVRDGSLTYWPALGHGRWDAPVRMVRAPRFEEPGPYGERFDPGRLLLGDVDGDGCADAVYVTDAGARVWINQAGTGFAAPAIVHGTPRVAEADVRLADVLGLGTQGVLWTYDVGAQRDSTYKFLDLTGARKPYLLSSIDNGTGGRTHVEYVSSSRFAAADAQAGRRWQTSLPFPVQVVARVVVEDEFSANTLSSEFSYHDGHWDAREADFRFGHVVQRDVSAREGEAVPTPPVETRTWMHLGPVEPTVAATREYWSGDPGLLAQTDVDLPAGASPAAVRLAARALAGRVLRSETYLLDGHPEREGRPCTVTENRFRVTAVLDGRAAADWNAAPVVVAQSTAARSAEWERGDDPHHRLTWTGPPDAYGRPEWTAQAGVPRRRDPTAAAPPGAPFAMTLTTTTWATRDDPARYLADRVAVVRRFEVRNDGSATAEETLEQALTSPISRVLRTLEVTRYDGAAFTGLAPGELGDHGAPTCEERLVHTPETLAQCSPPHRPLPHLLDPAAPAWPGEYPQGFRDATPALAGYRYAAADDTYAEGWYAYHARREFGPRGLVVRETDALGHETAVRYDDFDLLPARITDAAGLSRHAAYDMRTMLPELLTGVNGERTLTTYTPLALPRAVATMGQVGEEAGDTPEQPGTVYEYELRRLPVSVTTVRRTQHRWDTVAGERRRRAADGLPAPTEADIAALFGPDERSRFPERFVRVVEFSDGFGRLLQTRTQADEIVLDGLGLPADVEQPASLAEAHRRDAADAPGVVVSAWQLYDPKGRVAERYEPFFDAGWEYAPPSRERLEHELARTVTVFDPRGIPVRVRHPDGSEERHVRGVPLDLSDPDAFAPTVWEAYDYDRADNAGRTHPGATAALTAHRDTPRSVLYDPLGRAIETVQRDDGGRRVVTRSRYDIDGNVVEVTDPLGRTASRAAYDLRSRPWRTEMLDAGARYSVLGPLDTVLETADARGALTLVATDALHRIERRWARDRAGESVTLRERFEYGESSPVLSRPQAAELRLLGQVSRSFDEAGVMTVAARDLLGNPSRIARRVWQATAPPGPIDWDAGAAEDLLEAGEHVLEQVHDALGRRVEVIGPRCTDGERRSIELTYGRSGQLTGLSVDGTPYVRQLIHNARGQRVLAALGNGVVIRCTYDPATFLVTRMRAERAQQLAPLRWMPGSVLHDSGYGYDLFGNAVSLRDRAPGSGVAGGPADALDRAFAYDALDRLVGATGRECDAPLAPELWSDQPRCTDVTRSRRWTEQYRYDDVGNLLELAHRAGPGGTFTRTFVPAADGNRIMSVTGGGVATDYTYDDGGHVATETTSRHFDFDHAGRMTGFRVQLGAAPPSTTATYRYDSNGRRVSKVVRRQGGELEVTTYIGELFERLTLAGPGGAATTEHDMLHLLDGASRIAALRIGAPVPLDPMPAVTYLLGDHLGSVTEVLDSAGLLLNREHCTPFGETCFGSYRRKRYRFTAKERDEETGWYYHGARYYLPYACRWASCDPAGHADGLALYTYCRNRPVGMVDPTGKSAAPVLEPPWLPLPPSAPRPPLRLVPPPPPLATPPAGVLPFAGAALFLAASMALLGATIYAAAKGEKTPIDHLDDATGMHLGDIAGWVRGQYSKAAEPVVAKRNDGAERRAFREWVTARIMEGCNGQEHPLRKLLDQNGRPHKAADKWSEDPIFDSGHGRSNHPTAGGKGQAPKGGAQAPNGKNGAAPPPGQGTRLGVEDSLNNRLDGFLDERQGIIFEKILIDICGVPVELRTAKLYEAAGILPKGTVANAPVVAGWSPVTGYQPPPPPPPAATPSPPAPPAKPPILAGP